MQNGTIPDSTITASSSLSANDGPQNARLHHQIGGLLYGAWRPLLNDADQWLQVDFSVERQVTVVATQGREEGLFWVKTYLLSYSLDGMNYTMYERDGGAKVTALLLHRQEFTSCGVVKITFLTFESCIVGT